MTLTKRSPQVRHARAWLKLLRAETQARAEYLAADEPRARERARKRWLQAQRDWGKIGHNPSDEALKLAREK